MKVVKQARTKDGMKVQIEDWYETFPKIHKPCDVLAAFPVIDNNRGMTPRERKAYRCGETIRISFQFENGKQALVAMAALCNGKCTLASFEKFLDANSARFLKNVMPL